MKCPVPGCQWKRQSCMPRFDEYETINYHLSAVARDEMGADRPHEKALLERKASKKPNRTEVFIAFTKTSNCMELEQTLDAWDTDEYEPIGIQVQAHRFDIQRMATAEGLTKGKSYILAEFGSRPDSPKGWRLYQKGSMKVEEMQEWPSQSSSPSGTAEPS